ncbi:hypothetical protein, partial [Chromatium okenii]|uniref:hypothetical protein n=1 Tax=Chromatium okenii TaxID=61644 RepID=UPI0026F24745
ADTDGDFFTLSLTPSNGTLGNLIDAQPATSNFELIGNAATLNAALAHATFVATARGAASITFAVTDIAGATSVATYPLIATGNRAPMLTGAAPILLPNGQEDTPYTVQATT